jgi:hypothetical protein
LRGDQPELGAVTADGVDQHGALANEQLAASMKHQHALPLGALDRHQAHGRPGHRLADRLSVGRIVLLPPGVSLHVRGRHQLHLVPERAQLAGPEVCGCAGLHPDPAGRQSSEKSEHFGSPQLLPDGDLASGVNALDLKDVLGEVETDRDNVHGGRFLHDWPLQQRPTVWRIDAENRGRPPHQSNGNLSPLAAGGAGEAVVRP